MASNGDAVLATEKSYLNLFVYKRREHNRVHTSVIENEAVRDGAYAKSTYTEKDREKGLLAT